MIQSAEQLMGFWKGLSAVFLDRDGVINEKMPEGKYVAKVTDFRILPGVAEGIARLNRAGILVLLVSNQRGVALGSMTLQDVENIHRALNAELQQSGAHLDGIYFCPHDKDSCTCRKPLPGLFRQAQQKFPAISVEASVMIGDSASDIEFGRRLGMRTVWIMGDSENRKPGWETAEQLADYKADSLLSAVNQLLSL